MNRIINQTDWKKRLIPLQLDQTEMRYVILA